MSKSQRAAIDAMLRGRKRPPGPVSVEQMLAGFAILVDDSTRLADRALGRAALFLEQHLQNG